MDPEIIKQLLVQSPPAAAVITVVVLFLKHLSTERRADRHAMAEISANFQTAVKDLAASFQNQINDIEERDEYRRRELAALYERDRRETNEAIKSLVGSLTSNGDTLKKIQESLAVGVHPRVRGGDWKGQDRGD